MDLEEAEDEERDTIITTSICQHWSEPNDNSCSKLNCLFKSGINVGKKILVFGFVATSVPVVLPGFVVASAIGLAVSMPCAIFFVSHSCTQNLMSKLLPKPNPTHQGHDPLRLEDACFKQDIDITHLSKDDEEERDIGMVDVNEENVILDNDYGQGVVNEEFEPELSHSSDANNVIQCNGSEKDSTDYFSQEEEEEEPSTQKLDDENPIMGVSDESGEFKAPFEFRVTTVVLEECEDEVKEGDIEEEEMQKETKGLLEKIRDEGKNDMRGEYANRVSSGASENHQDIGGVVENMEVGREDKQNLVTEEEMGIQEDSRECEETVKSRNVDNEDSVCNEVESCEPARGNLELEVDGSNDSQKPVDETSEVLLDGRGFQDEPIGDFLIETHGYSTLVADDSSDVIDDKTDTDEKFKEQPEPTILQKAVLDDNMDIVCNEVESCEPGRGISEVNGSNDSQKPVNEASEQLDGSGLQDEPIGDLLIETQVLNILVAEDSSDNTDNKTDAHENLKEELEPIPPQKRELSENISDLVNQETQLNECNKRMDSSDEDARELCDENRIDPDTYSCTIDLHEG
jgi:hypothetical protein